MAVGSSSGEVGRRFFTDCLQSPPRSNGPGPMTAAIGEAQMTGQRRRLPTVMIAAATAMLVLSTLNSAAYGAGTARWQARDHSPLSGKPALTLLPGVSAPGDEFGWSVAVAGQIAVAGAPGRHTRGAAYVFERSGGSWHLKQTLSEPGTTLFGNTVAVSGTTLAVGAVANAASNSGAVYIFARTAAGRWRLHAVLTSPITRPSYGTFGAALAVAPSTLVIGGFGVKPVNGKVFIYVRSAGDWRLQATLSDATHSPLAFGVAVSVTDTRSGTYAVVGDSCAGSGCTGAADIFRRPLSGTRWHLQARLKVPHILLFGLTVGISGDTAVVGGDFSAYVFRRSGRLWRQHSKLTPSRPRHVNMFGQSVAISGARALVGDPFTGARPRVCGTAYEFVPSRLAWRERAQVVNPGCAAGDSFGSSVALSGTTAVIGAPGWHNSAGAVYRISLP